MITEEMQKQLKDEIGDLIKKYDPDREWLKIVVIDVKSFHNMRVGDAAEIIYELLLAPIKDLIE